MLSHSINFQTRFCCRFHPALGHDHLRRLSAMTDKQLFPDARGMSQKHDRGVLELISASTYSSVHRQISSRPASSSLTSTRPSMTNGSQVGSVPPIAVSQNAEIGHATDQPCQEISITMSDGAQLKGMSWKSSPMEVATQISKFLSEKLVIAKVDGVLWDLERPLEKSCSLELLDFEHPEGVRCHLLPDNLVDSHRSQASKFSGIRLQMSSEKHLRNATFPWVLPQMKASSMI